MPVRLGFIGFGIMGERLLRAALAHDPRVVIVGGVFDPASGTGNRVAAIDSSILVHASADDVIAASDCLHIASPPASHIGYLRQCAAAGKAALCEKPLATDVASAELAVQALIQANIRAAVNFPFASSLAVDQLARWIGDSEIGNPQSVHIELGFANWPRSWQMDAASWLDGRGEGGFTREVGSHFLFLSLRLLGALKLQTSRCVYSESGKSERSINATLVAGNVPLSLEGSVGGTSKDDHNTWTLTGSKGRVRICDWSFAEREVGGVWQAPSEAMPNEKARPLVLARQIEKLAKMTRGEATNLATLDEALAVQKIVESILMSPAA